MLSIEDESGISNAIIDPELYERNRSLVTYARFLLVEGTRQNVDKVCHAKTLALLYTAGNDVHLSAAYDFLTTTVYASYQYNPPGIGFMGKKTWTPGQTLPRFIAGTFGIPVREQALLVEAISDAVSDVVPLVQEKMAEHTDFRDIGKRMLLAWQEGVNGLREKRVYASGEWSGDRAFEGISDAPQTRHSIRRYRSFTADGQPVQEAEKVKGSASLSPRARHVYNPSVAARKFVEKGRF